MFLIPRYYSPRSHDSSVVQSVERRTVNPYVTGSSPVRGAKFREACLRKLRRAFCFLCTCPNFSMILIQQVSVRNLPEAFSVFPPKRMNLVVRFGVRLVRWRSDPKMSLNDSKIRKSNKTWSTNHAVRLFASMDNHISPTFGDILVTELKTRHFTA